MTNEVFNMMKFFPHSFINALGEVILDQKENIYFTVRNCENKFDIICKMLEWVSRAIAKCGPYKTESRNLTWRKDLLDELNGYLEADFTLEDMNYIYDKLGNSVNHEMTLKFIESGYDLKMVYPEEGKEK